MLTREHVKNIRQDIQDLLNEFEGGKAVLGSAKFTDTNITFKLEVAVANETGLIESSVESDYRRHAPMFGLDKIPLGAKFTMRGNAYTIVGLKPRSRKFPVIGQRQDGKKFKFNADDVKRGLKT